MSNKRFFATSGESNIFTFTVDTRNIVAGATDGSQLDNQYILPLTSDSGHNGNKFIIRVNDGRPDISVVGRAETDTKKIITFSSPGVYQISIIGTITGRYSTQDQPDRLKLIEVNNWSQTIYFYNAFYGGCSNLVIKAINPISLSGSASRNMFYGIKGFDSKEAMMAIIVVNVTDSASMFRGITSLPLKWMPNAFWNEVTTLSQTFFGSKIDNSVSIIEINAPKLTSVVSLFFSTQSTNTDLRLVIRAPLTSIDKLWYGSSPDISFGEVDIRNLTYCNQLYTKVSATSKVDATLLGWVNNFDWSGIAPVTNKVTIDFYNSKYSNNPSVIAAKDFLEAKGYIFTNLTMA